MSFDLEALKSAHGDVFTLEVDGETIAFRRAKRVEYKAFMAKAADDRSKIADAQEILALDRVVHPTRAEFMAFLDRFPAVAGTIANELIGLAQGKEVDEAKKA